MVSRIESDRFGFQQRLRKLKTRGLERYFSRDHIVAPGQNGKTIRIPIDIIEIPRFVFGEKEFGGVGQGDGNVGDSWGDDDQKNYGTGHGSGAGRHSFAELSLEEAADMLSSHLELPNLLEKFNGQIGIQSQKKYKGSSSVGPRALRNFRRTYQEALKRTIASGTYNPKIPILIRREDERYRSPVESFKPATKAAIIYLIDYSGSMSRVINFLQHVGWWANAWISKHYHSVDHRYVQYDSSATEVPANEFYSTQAGGGTNINAGLQFVKNMAKREYPENEYNLYLVHFTDGDCYGIKITEDEVAWHKEMSEQEPDYYSTENMPEIGNPLTDFLIPRCSAVFVCEAGGYYGSYQWNDQQVGGNYSDLLQQLIDSRPSLDKKLRVVSFEDDEIQVARGEKIKETLVHWFG
ncbi:TPA: DUF444 family protein [Candidatus Woesearchaeota archaeon]|nr:DUF444 family protein [Candidatus Woesearchaeota archaeon]